MKTSWGLDLDYVDAAPCKVLSFAFSPGAFASMCCLMRHAALQPVSSPDLCGHVCDLCRVYLYRMAYHPVQTIAATQLSMRPPCSGCTIIAILQGALLVYMAGVILSSSIVCSA